MALRPEVKDFTDIIDVFVTATNDPKFTPADWAGLMADASTVRDSVYTSMDSLPLTPEEEYRFYGDELTWYMAKAGQPGIPLQAAKSNATVLKGAVEDYAKFKPNDPAVAAQLKEQLDWTVKQAQVIIDYPGDPMSPAPDWDKQVGHRFWRKPSAPSGGGMGWWWLLLLAAGGAYVYYKRK